MNLHIKTCGSTESSFQIHLSNSIGIDLLHCQFVFYHFLFCGFCSFNHRRFLNKNSFTVVNDTDKLIYFFPWLWAGGRTRWGGPITINYSYSSILACSALLLLSRKFTVRIFLLDTLQQWCSNRKWSLKKISLFSAYVIQVLSSH